MFANHGPADAATPWTIATDYAVPLASIPDAIDAFAPLIELLTSILEPTAIGQSHVIFLACSLAGFNKALVPALEELYHVDFMASTDTTGGAAAGGNWKMETDDFNFGKVYCDAKKLEKYRGSMPFFIPLLAAACVATAVGTTAAVVYASKDTNAPVGKALGI